LPSPDGGGSLVVALDLHRHEAVIEHSSGAVERVPLTPDRPVAEVTRDVLAAVARVGGPVQIYTTPQEVPWSVPLDEDYQPTRYDTEPVRDYFTAASQEFGAFLLKFAAQPNPEATMSGVAPASDARLGSAPAATSMRMASRSVAWAALQNGVAPAGSIHA
jgi:hypothetical protein